MNQNIISNVFKNNSYEIIKGNCKFITSNYFIYNYISDFNIVGDVKKDTTIVVIEHPLSMIYNTFQLLKNNYVQEITYDELIKNDIEILIKSPHLFLYNLLLYNQFKLDNTNDNIFFIDYLDFNSNKLKDIKINISEGKTKYYPNLYKKGTDISNSIKKITFTDNKYFLNLFVDIESFYYNKLKNMNNFI